jgi:hypothetical protein
MSFLYNCLFIDAVTLLKYIVQHSNERYDHYYNNKLQKMWKEVVVA